MHYAISLKIPTVTQLRTIYPAPICFPEEAITTALHITFSTGLIRQQALCWHGGFPLWPRINTIPYCFEAPALTRQTALRAHTGQQVGSGLKFLTEKTATTGLWGPQGANTGIHPLPLAVQCSFICHSPLSIPMQLFQWTKLFLLFQTIFMHLIGTNLGGTGNCQSQSDQRATLNLQYWLSCPVKVFLARSY